MMISFSQCNVEELQDADLEYYVAIDLGSTLTIMTAAFDRAREVFYMLDVLVEPMDFPTQMKKILEYARRTRLPLIEGDVKIAKVFIEYDAWKEIVERVGDTEIPSPTNIKVDWCSRFENSVMRCMELFIAWLEKR